MGKSTNLKGENSWSVSRKSCRARDNANVIQHDYVFCSEDRNMQWNSCEPQMNLSINQYSSLCSSCRYSKDLVMYDDSVVMMATRIAKGNYDVFRGENRDVQWSNCKPHKKIIWMLAPRRSRPR